MGIMANTEIRDLVKNYQESTMEDPNDRYSMFTEEGVSGCEDIYLMKASLKAGEYLIKRKYMCHITMYEKLDDEILKFSMREFIELMSYYDLNLADRKGMLEESEVQFLKYREVDDYNFSRASKLSF